MPKRRNNKQKKLPMLPTLPAIPESAVENDESIHSQPMDFPQGVSEASEGATEHMIEVDAAYNAAQNLLAEHTVNLDKMLGDFLNNRDEKTEEFFSSLDIQIKTIDTLSRDTLIRFFSEYEKIFLAESHMQVVQDSCLQDESNISPDNTAPSEKKHFELALFLRKRELFSAAVLFNKRFNGERQDRVDKLQRLLCIVLNTFFKTVEKSPQLTCSKCLNDIQSIIKEFEFIYEGGPQRFFKRHEDDIFSKMMNIVYSEEVIENVYSVFDFLKSKLLISNRRFNYISSVYTCYTQKDMAKSIDFIVQAIAPLQLEKEVMNSTRKKLEDYFKYGKKVYNEIAPFIVQLTIKFPTITPDASTKIKIILNALPEACYDANEDFKTKDYINFFSAFMEITARPFKAGVFKMLFQYFWDNGEEKLREKLLLINEVLAKLNSHFVNDYNEVVICLIEENILIRDAPSIVNYVNTFDAKKQFLYSSFKNFPVWFELANDIPELREPEILSAVHFIDNSRVSEAFNIAKELNVTLKGLQLKDSYTKLLALLCKECLINIGINEASRNLKISLHDSQSSKNNYYWNVYKKNPFNKPLPMLTRQSFFEKTNELIAFKNNHADCPELESLSSDEVLPVVDIINIFSHHEINTPENINLFVRNYRKQPLIFNVIFLLSYCQLSLNEKILETLYKNLSYMEEAESILNTLGKSTVLTSTNFVGTIDILSFSKENDADFYKRILDDNFSGNIIPFFQFFYILFSTKTKVAEQLVESLANAYRRTPLILDVLSILAFSCNQVLNENVLNFLCEYLAHMQNIEIIAKILAQEPFLSGADFIEVVKTVLSKDSKTDSFSNIQSAVKIFYTLISQKIQTTPLNLQLFSSSNARQPRILSRHLYFEGHFHKSLNIEVFATLCQDLKNSVLPQDDIIERLHMLVQLGENLLLDDFINAHGMFKLINNNREKSKNKSPDHKLIQEITLAKSIYTFFLNAKDTSENFYQLIAKDIKNIFTIIWILDLFEIVTLENINRILTLDSNIPLVAKALEILNKTKEIKIYNAQEYLNKITNYEDDVNITIFDPDIILALILLYKKQLNTENLDDIDISTSASPDSATNLVEIYYDKAIIAGKDPINTARCLVILDQEKWFDDNPSMYQKNEKLIYQLDSKYMPIFYEILRTLKTLKKLDQAHYTELGQKIKTIENPEEFSNRVIDSSVIKAIFDRWNWTWTVTQEQENMDVEKNRKGIEQINLNENSTTNKKRSIMAIESESQNINKRQNQNNILSEDPSNENEMTVEDDTKLENNNEMIVEDDTESESDHDYFVEIERIKNQYPQETYNNVNNVTIMNYFAEDNENVIVSENLVPKKVDVSESKGTLASKWSGSERVEIYDKEVEALPDFMISLISLADLRHKSDLLGFTFHDVPGDGSCFFHALFDQLEEKYPSIVTNFNIQNYTDLRKLAVAKLRDNKEEYIPFLGENSGDIDSCIERFERDEVWAEDFVISVIAQILNIKIILINSDGNAPTHIDGGNGSSLSTVYLGYQTGVHFVSLRGRPIDGSIPDSQMPPRDEGVQSSRGNQMAFFGKQLPETFSSISKILQCLKRNFDTQVPVDTVLFKECMRSITCHQLKNQHNQNSQEDDKIKSILLDICASKEQYQPNQEEQLNALIEVSYFKRLLPDLAAVYGPRRK